MDGNCSRYFHIKGEGEFHMVWRRLTTILTGYHPHWQGLPITVIRVMALRNVGTFGLCGLSTEAVLARTELSRAEDRVDMEVVWGGWCGGPFWQDLAVVVGNKCMVFPTSCASSSCSTRWHYADSSWAYTLAVGQLSQHLVQLNSTATSREQNNSLRWLSVFVSKTIWA